MYLHMATMTKQREDDSSLFLMYHCRCKLTVKITKVFLLTCTVLILSIYAVECGEPLKIMHFLWLSHTHPVGNVKGVFMYLSSCYLFVFSQYQQWGKTTLCNT